MTPSLLPVAPFCSSSICSRPIVLSTLTQAQGGNRGGRGGGRHTGRGPQFSASSLSSPPPTLPCLGPDILPNWMSVAQAVVMWQEGRSPAQVGLELPLG